MKSLQKDERRWVKASMQFQAADDPTLSRRFGRPTARWADALDHCVARVYGKEHGETWRNVIDDEASWLALEEEFLR